ncbi:hypothetical protein RRG08_002157 [Elysia crispata]|uniref:Uncharacterized protein n=1 Tax=Elysia crispata TaxID=231223 RepID=A0AAE0ZC12_9GAST|nr:hypothetical protein RRG08_002157 [Elysia crispata]
MSACLLNSHVSSLQTRLREEWGILCEGDIHFSVHIVLKRVCVSKGRAVGELGGIGGEGDRYGLWPGRLSEDIGDLFLLSRRRTVGSLWKKELSRLSSVAKPNQSS